MRKAITPDNWKLKVLKTDRNEVRLHVSTALVSIFYKDAAGLKSAYNWVKANVGKAVAFGIKEEYRRLKKQGA